ncbi:hypothetical protein [Hymenobacter arizonensis]|uniref:Uncharacterized protein n=1 Tax=Hymenobacter arizonensis TaxID=1227077 RepID=A0A1I5ZR57_HYMAR|nr:hypothetical protein [Hymenobacter arizonensis]SFQ58890.1 hypothetical protein SAMN04515668_3139 [Hymenobacter arizonensis]
MKAASTTLLLTLFALSAQAQEVKTDKLTKLTNEEILVNVIAVNDREVSFTYPGETAVNVLNKNQVKEIGFASGRVEKITERVVIASEEDWQKVIVTTLESDVVGLTRKGEVRAKAAGATALSNQANIDARATEKLKREAARMGAHIILIQAQNTQRGSMGNAFQTAQVPTSLKQGVAYSY